MRLVTLATAALLAVGCGGDGGPNLTVERPECENLNPRHCMMPWPSSRYLTRDDSTETGWRLSIPQQAMPQNLEGKSPGTSYYERFDGVTPSTALITVYPGELDTENLPDETEIAQSLEPDSPTVLLDAETGERVAHFAEVDRWREADPEMRSFYIRPAARLKEDHRYIAAVRNLERKDGSPVHPSDYFRALRDEIPTQVEGLESRRERFEEIFSKLSEAGVERDGLIEAWDFHTSSGQVLWEDAVTIRDKMVDELGPEGLGCTIDDVQENVSDNVWRRVRGTFTVPLYLEGTEPGAATHRDSDGQPTLNTMAEAPFEVAIPPSVRDRIQNGGDPARLVVYGHGQFGTAAQVSSEGTSALLEHGEMVGAATDTWGMAEEDVDWVLEELVTDWTQFPRLPERLTQGINNYIALSRTMMGVCRDEEALQVDGTPVLGDEVYYYGISQGGIYGASIAALHPDIDRYALQVGGVSYPLLVRRSINFRPFETFFKTWYRDKLDRDFLLVSASTPWDMADPATFAPHLLEEPLRGSSTKRVLYQIVRWDSQVSNVASAYAARTMGLKMLPSSVYEPWNLQTAEPPVDSAFIAYDVGAEPAPKGVQPVEERNGAHGELRFKDAVLQQLDTFMRPDGQVEDFCDGPCEVN
jgi:hypothetical protein